MCKYMNGAECECEFVNSNVCNNPSDCEYMIEDTKEYDKTISEVIKEEVKSLAKHYIWEWDKDDMCYYADNGVDIADTVYYDTDGYMIHPKELASHLTKYLHLRDFKNYMESLIAVKSIERYYGIDKEYSEKDNVYKVIREDGYRIRIKEIQKHFNIDVLELNYDNNHEFLVVKLLDGD